MQYLKLKIEGTMIEVHNSWLGVETVTVNGKKVSEASSVFGFNHYFTVQESSGLSQYHVITKVLDDFGNVGIDVKRNGQFLYRNLPLSFSFIMKRSNNKHKKLGLEHLRNYDIELAISNLEASLEEDSYDWEAHFHLACAYSNIEDTKKALFHLSKAVENGLKDTDSIMTYEMLAFVRIQDEFDEFLERGFKLSNT